MAEQEIKLKITTDASGAVTGINAFTANLKKLANDSESLSSKLKKNWIEVSAAVYAAQATMAKAVQMMGEGAAAMRVESSFKIVAEEHGASAEAMIANLKKLTRETIDDSDLMAKANKMMLAGYDPKQIEKFAAVAGTAAKYMGTTTGEAFERMSDALASRMPKALVQAGAATTTQMKIIQQAIRAGADDTMLFELAIANLAIKQLELQGTQDEATVSIQRYHAQAKQTAETIGVVLVRASQMAYAIFQALGAAGLGLSSTFWKLASAAASFAAMITFGDASKQFKEYAANFKAYAESDAQMGMALMKQANDNMLGTAEVGKRASKEEIEAAKKSRDAILDKMKAYVDTAKNGDKALKILMDANKQLYQAEIEAAEHTAKMKILAGGHELAARLEQIGTEQDSLNKLYKSNTDAIGKMAVSETIKNAQLEKVWEEYSKNWDKNEHKRGEITKEINNLIRDSQVELMKAIGPYSAAYVEAEVVQIQLRYKKMKDIVNAAEQEGIKTAAEASKLRVNLVAAEANEIARLRKSIAMKKYAEEEDYYNVTKGPFSKEAIDALKKKLQEQAEIKSLDTGLPSNEYATAMMENELAKRLQFQADYYRDIGGFEKKHLQVQLEAIEARRVAEIRATGDVNAANQKALQETTAAYQQFFAGYIENIGATAQGWGQMFEGLSQLYAQDSAERQRYHDIAMGFMVAEKIAAFALAVTKAVEACANAAANGDPYTAVARIAAVAAALGAVFASAGMSMHLGGGGGSPAPLKEQSTVLGAERGTASESVDRSMKLLEDTYNLQYRELRGIHDAVRGLNTSITGLVRVLVFGAGSFDTGFFQQVSWGARPSWTSTAGKIGSFGIGAFSADPFTATTHTILEQLFGGALGKNIGKFLGSIFGGTVTANTTGAGITYGVPTVGGIQSGQDISALWYNTVHYHKEGGWFHSDKDWDETSYESAGEDVNRLLTQVYRNMSDTLVELTEQFGTDLQKTLAYQFGAVTLDLRGMSGEQIEKTLKEYFSKIGDIAVGALFGDIVRQYQKVGEGMMEAATRLINDRAIVLETLEATGKAFEGTGVEAIDLSESLIELAGGLEKLTDAASYYFDNFYSAAEQFAYNQNQITEAFADMDIAFPKSRQMFKDLVESCDLSTFAGQELYVTLLQMAEATDQYYDQLDEWVSKVRDARESMRMEGMVYEQQRATAGQLALQTTLEQARLGNYSMIENLDLNEIANQASSTALFATRREYQASYYRTYNSLSELERIIGGGLTVDEQQLNIQKAMLEELRQLNGKAAQPEVGSWEWQWQRYQELLKTNPGLEAPIRITGYASGGDFSGGWRIVGENGPEIERTGPSRIYSNKESIFDISELITEMRALRTDVNAIGYAIAKATGKTAKTIDRWEVDGIPTERTLT